MKYAFLAIATFALVLGCGSKTEEPATTANPSATVAVSFSTVQPIFTENCAGCHGDANPKEGISLTNYANVMKGGREGAVVTPGDPGASVIVQAMRGQGKKQMPPGKPLPEDKIAAVEGWIKAGAKE